MNLLGKLEKSRQFWFLLIVSVVFFFLRFPSLFEPYWYGDEGIYQALGLGIDSGRLLYRDAFDNKPPLLYILYSFVSSDQFLIRLLSLIFGLLAIIVFYFLCKKILNSSNNKPAFIATSFFALLFGLPIIEGNIANAENFMLLPTLVAGFLVFKSLEYKILNTRYKILFLAGLTIGVSFLFKIVALFDFVAFTAFLIFINYSGELLSIFKKENFIRELKNILPFVIGFVIPISLTTLYFLFNNAFPYFLQAVLFNNIGYVNYGNKFIIPQGLLIFKLILLFSFSLFVFSKRKIYPPSFTFVCLWLAFSLFDSYFSQRPYTHYVLVLLPAFCLMIGLFLANKNFSKIAGVLTISTFIAVLLSFTFFLRTIYYYPNFISFITGSKSVEAYQRFFDGNTPRDYEIASYINLKTKATDNIFVWGNNAQIYKLTKKLPPGKYTVAYHITSYKDGLSNTTLMLNKQKPKYIIIMPNVSPYPFRLSNYSHLFNLDGVEIYEKIF